MSSPKDHVAVRLDGDTLSRIDALKDVLSTAWHEATRSDVLRAVILNGLGSMEVEHRVALSKRKPPAEAPATKASASTAKASGPGSKPGAAKRGKPKGRPAS